MKRPVLLASLLSVVALLCVGLFVRLDPNVSALLPREGAVLSRYLTVFGGGGLSVALLEGDDPAEVERAAAALAEALRARPEVRFAETGVPDLAQPDPLLLWRNADAGQRAALAQALTPEGMRERLRETRQLLLAPGSGSSSEAIAADPLRLVEVLSTRGTITPGFAPRDDGRFATEDGTSALVVIKPEGQALRGESARAFAAAADHEAEQIASRHGVRVGLTGPHTIAAQMERMLRRDLGVLGAIATALASVAFVLVFRRARAVLAIIVPLGLGTLWTTAFAALWPSGLSAIAIAFTSVVVGVGFDSGIHVYSALLEARRAGLSPEDAASAARKEVGRPVLVAAAIAATAFASLSLSSVEAIRQFGLLCAAGELLTAFAILLLTPAIGARLEAGAPPAPRPNAFGHLARVTGTRGRAAVTLAACAVVAGLWLVRGPRIGESVVAVRPSGLAALEVEARVFDRFGGQRQPYVVLFEGRDREEVMARADHAAEALAAAPGELRIDGLASLLPAERTQRARLVERDALDLPARAAELEAALADVGFAPARFSGILAAMKSPPSQVQPVEGRLGGALGALAARHLAEQDGVTYVTLHVHGASLAALEPLVRAVDPQASVTGYARLEADLRAALARDLPRVGGVALVIVCALLALGLRRLDRTLVALSALGLGIGILLSLVSLLDLPLHIYSALVLPVLLGISVDEAMFLLHGAEGGGEGAVRRSLERHGPAVVTTALTTSAGFLALAFASYDGLRDLGRVGALGNMVVLVVSLLVVPAGLTLARRRA